MGRKGGDSERDVLTQRHGKNNASRGNGLNASASWQRYLQGLRDGIAPVTGAKRLSRRPRFACIVGPVRDGKTRRGGGRVGYPVKTLIVRLTVVRCDNTPNVREDSVGHG